MMFSVLEFYVVILFDRILCDGHMFNWLRKSKKIILLPFLNNKYRILELLPETLSLIKDVFNK